MSIEKYIESFREKYQYSQLIYGYEELEDVFRTSLEEYGREVIDKCIEALPPLSTDHEWDWSEGYNQCYLEAHRNLNNLK